MKKIAALLLLVMTSVGCVSSTQYGQCIGVGEDRKPDLVYKMSGWNAFWGVMGVEMIFPTVIWLVDDFYCPVGYQAVQK